jgi:hypothetical protein
LNALLNYFVDLCLLRAAPQDLPAAPVLVRLAFLANVLVGAMLVAGSDIGVGLALAESLVEVGLMLVVLRVALGWRGREARFVQTATAVMGSSTFLGILALPLLGMTRGASGDAAALAGLILLVLVVWSVVVLGHIVRHAFDLALGQGVAVGVLYTLATYLLLSALFPFD